MFANFNPIAHWQLLAKVLMLLIRAPLFGIYTNKSLFRLKKWLRCCCIDHETITNASVTSSSKANEIKKTLLHHYERLEVAMTCNI